MMMNFHLLIKTYSVFRLVDIGYLQRIEIVQGLDVLEDGFDGIVQCLVLAIVSLAGEVDDVALHKFYGLLLMLRCVDGNGESALRT